MSLKANKYIRETGQSCTRISINFTIKSDKLISAVMLLLDVEDKSTVKLTKKAVEEKLRQELWIDGYWFDEDMQGKVINHFEDEKFNELTKLATEKTKELFPEFFIIVEPKGA